MMSKTKIGNFEACCLLLNTITSKIILDFPRYIAEDGGTAGWLMTLLISAAVFCLFAILAKVYQKYAGQDILAVGEKAFGGIGKIIPGILFLIQFMVIAPFALREYTEDIKVISLNSTPISLVNLLFCIGMVIGAYLGLESLARIHVLVLPVLAFAFIFILALNAPRFDLSKLAPWLGLGVDVMIKKGAVNVSIYSGITILFFIMPYLNQKDDYAKIGRYSIFLSGLFLVLSSLCYLLIYQYPTATEFFLPMYQMARAIRIGRFFTRIESAFIFIWASSAFLYLSSSLYFITWLFQKTFQLKYRKPLIIPFTILIFTLSMIPENLNETLRIQQDLYRNFSWVLSYLVLLVLPISASVKLRRNRAKKAVTK